jgi:hypothetical protein
MTRLIIVVPVVSLLLAPLHGQTFDYIERWSAVSIRGEITGAPPPYDAYERWTSTTDLDPFDESVADEIQWGQVTVAGNAGQISSLTATQINAEGDVHAHIYDDSGMAEALAWSSSLIEVTFDLSEPAPVEMTGWLYIPPGQGPPYLLDSHVTLSQWIEGDWWEIYDAVGEAPVDFADTLEAGRYFLDVGCFVEARTDFGEPPIIGSARYELSLLIVPEPSTLILLLLAGLAARRR